jgi:lambda repressor-like predicted transcriptional regulator
MMMTVDSDGTAEQQQTWARIEDAIKRKGWNLSDLADNIGTSRATITGWKVRRSWPSGWSCVLIAEALGESMDYLFRGLGGPGQEPLDSTVTGAVARGANLALTEIEAAVRQVRSRYQGLAAAARTPDGARVEATLLQALAPAEVQAVMAPAEGPSLAASRTTTATASPSRRASRKE